MEFTGDGLSHLTMDDRLCMANMAIEAGGKNGIFEVDDKTVAFFEERSARPYAVYKADADAQYENTYEIDLSSLRPTVAFPHLPENTRPVDEAGGIKIHQVVIGSCTNGRLEDLRVAAKILSGKRVAKGVRVIIIPATQKIYLDAMQEGLQNLCRIGVRRVHADMRPCLGGQWASSPRASAHSPPPTATLWANGSSRARCIYAVRPSPPRRL